MFRIHALFAKYMIAFLAMMKPEFRIDFILAIIAFKKLSYSLL